MPDQMLEDVAAGYLELKIMLDIILNAEGRLLLPSNCNIVRVSMGTAIVTDLHPTKNSAQNTKVV